MRITDGMTYRLLQSSIAMNKKSLHTLQAQIASGRKINLPSDGPGAYEIIHRLRKDLSGMNQYATNAQRVDHELLVADNAMQQMLSLFQRASELAIAGGDGAHSPETLVTLGKEVDELLGSLLDIANTSVGGRFIFGGTETLARPFDTTIVDDLVVGVNYTGNQETRMVEVSRGVFIEANVPGSDAAGANGLFQTDTHDLFADLIQLRDRLLAGETTNATTALADVSAGLDHIVNHLSSNGGRRERIQLSLDMLGQHQVNIEKALQNEEAIDIAEAVTHLTQSQSAYEAALQVTARLMGQPTLLDMM